MNQTLLGFEGLDATGFTLLGASTTTANAARTGARGLHCAPAPAVTFGCSFGSSRQVGPSNYYGIFMQFWVRINSAPSDDGSMLAGIAGGGDLRIIVNADRSWKFVKSGIGTKTSPQPILLNTWFRVIIKVWTSAPGAEIEQLVSPFIPNYRRLFKPGSSGTWGTAVLNASVEFLHRSPTTGAIDFYDSLFMAGDNLNSHNFFGGILGSQSGSFGVEYTNWSLDFDDVIYIDADGQADVNSVLKWGVQTKDGSYVPGIHALDSSPNPQHPSLFTYDRVWPIKITTQGSHNAWTPAGNASVIAPLPSAAIRAPLSVSGDVDAWTSYKHEAVAAANEAWFYQGGITHVPPLSPLILPANVEGFQVKGNAIASPASSHLLTDGLSPASPLSALTGVSAQGDANSPQARARFFPGSKADFMPVSQFNALEMGIQNKTGDTVTLTNLFMEVLMGPGGFLEDIEATLTTESVTPGAAPPGPGPEVLAFPPPYAAEACANPPNPPAGSGGATGCDT